ncbi:hypothetical protein LCGC14_0581590 [marine sediment metagenome]|uniref:Glycosyltransferase 2-like domain-containing protein n=1 Tax=marine sediment metagenome TaxID=412755 RepID=A0A0F9RL44_9ZZZZ
MSNVLPKSTLMLMAYREVLPKTHMSIVRDLRQWPQLGLAWAGNDPLIIRSRSIAASQFLEDPRYGDILLMCDHDISWDEGSLQKLAESAWDKGAVVAAIHSKRAFGLDLTFRPTLDMDTQVMITIGKDDTIECDYVSTGLIAIPRTILEELSRTLLETDGLYWPFFFLHGNRLSGDWAFCDLVYEVLGKERIFVHTGPRVGHTGEHVYEVGDKLVRTAEPVQIIPGDTE